MNRFSRRDRRACPRRLPEECGWLVSARLRPGRDVRVLELSNCGALVEGAARLAPGAPVELHLVGLDRRRAVRGRVVRCHVSAVDWSVGIHYRAALAFDHVGNHPILDESARVLDESARATVANRHAESTGSKFPQAEAFDLELE